MKKLDLIKQISNTIGKTKVLELSRILKEQRFVLHDLIDITFYPDKAIAFRAAWLLENVFPKIRRFMRTALNIYYRVSAMLNMPVVKGIMPKY